MDGAPADGWYHFITATEMGSFLPADEIDGDLKAGTAFVVQTLDKAAGLQFKAALATEN